MARLNNRISGDFTSAATWGVISDASFNVGSATTTTTTSYVESQSFIPGAITIDALALRLNGTIGVLGTFSARLALGGVTVPGTEVTINVSDLNANSVGWVVFALSAPVTLAAATSYTVSVRSSVAGSVSVTRPPVAGDWSRFLRTTTTAAPAATDDLFIAGEHLSAGVNNQLTVTINNTAATVFGAIEVSEKGILTAETLPSNTYRLTTSTNFILTGNSLVEFGTSVNPMPSSSTLTLQLNQAGVNVNFGILLQNNAIFRTFGAAKIGRALLAADVLVGATTITTNVATGWPSGDEIALAPTGNVASQLEARLLTGPAAGVTVPITATVFPHLGSGDFVGEIVNTTRNIRIQSDSATFGTYMLIAPATTCDFHNTEFTRMGSSTLNRRGLDVQTLAGSFTAQGCSFHRFNTSSFVLNINSPTNNNILVSDCVFYNTATTNGTTLGAGAGPLATIEDCWGFNSRFQFSNPNGIIRRIRGAASPDAIILNAASNAAVSLLVEDLVAHSNSAVGVILSPSLLVGLTVTNVTTWRNVRGVNVSGSSNLRLRNHVSYGNSFGIAVGSCANLTVEDSTYYGSTGIIQNTGAAFEAAGFNHVFNNCSFGIPTAHTTGDINFPTARAWHDTKFNNCLFGSTTEAANLANLPQNATIGSGRHDQTAGVHRAWRRTATLSSDSVIQSSPPRSLRIAPSVAAQKTLAPVKGFAIPTGLTATVTVAIRRSVAGDGTAYNGALPRLWLRQNNAAGIVTDTLLATATAASLGQFEVLSGAIPAATDNTVNYVYVDLDGTAGWVNIDRWTLNINGGTANATNLSTEDFWQDGLPFLGVNTTLTVQTNQESYWLDGVPVQQLYPTSTLQTGRFFAFFQ